MRDMSQRLAGDRQARHTHTDDRRVRNLSQHDDLDECQV